MAQDFDLAVIGGGVVGLATAYKFQQKFPKKTVAIFEKENRLAAHQTGRNSGVIHSGVYYKPGSLKAQNCRDGRKQLVAFAKKHKVNHDICGKIILATEKNELPRLEKIYQRGLENLGGGIEKIGIEKIKELEPFAEGIEAIHVPMAGIIDYKQLCQTLVDEVFEINSRSDLFLDTTVQESFEEDGKSGLKTSEGIFYAKQKIFCAGLQADRMLRKDGGDTDLAIVGFRGDYYELTEAAKFKVKNLIYPVPDPAFPFLGVHFTRMTNGSVECGPNAVFSFKREGYSKTAFSAKDTYEALAFPGTVRLFKKHYRKGMDEYRRAFSKKKFLRALQKMLPSLQMDEIIPARSGVRAQALLKNGELYDDFKIEKEGNSIHVLNAPSPAATACLAIADEILEFL